MRPPLKQLGICVVIGGRTVNEFKKNIRSALRLNADALELRLDFIYQILSDHILTELLPLCRHKPVIVTLRNTKRGGMSRLPDGQEIEWLQKAINLGAQYVDIDVNMPTKYVRMLRKNSACFILSSHDFKKTPHAKEQLKISRRMIKQGADICKIATFARTPSDCIETFSFINTLLKQKIPVIGIAMGTHGKLSRILALPLGCLLTYASVSQYDQKIAPGMLSIKQLRSCF